MDSSNVAVVYAIEYYISLKTRVGKMSIGIGTQLYHIASYDEKTYSC